LADDEGQHIRFVCGSADELPFRDGRFTHVVSRVTLNYVHQQRAFSEMVRVLQPGGFLYCRIAGPGHDLRLLSQTRTPRRFLGCVYNFCFGLTLELVGWQPRPGRRLSPSYTFATARRLTRLLQRFHCTPVHIRSWSRQLFLPGRIEVLAKKC
jgi:SAM-dependent methyltransferase